MSQMVSITSQGQLTIPKKFRDLFGIRGATKARVHQEGGRLIVEPTADFWSLAGSMKSDIVLTDEELRNARAAFETDWARSPV